jgi:hypothetical protein
MPDLSYDSKWYETRTLVKNLVRDQAIKKISDKAELVRSMKFFFPDDHGEFLPSGWPLDQVRELKEGEILIVKPTTGARGEGISVVTTQGELEEAKERIKREYRGAGVACNYIRDPYTFRGKKFHFRSYLLCTSTGEFHVYPKSKILTAAENYQDSDYSNKRIHDSHGDTTETDFFFPHDIPESDREKISAGISEIMSRLQKFLRGNIRNYSESAYAYQIVGPDILFDSSLRPWLLEVNLRPQMGPMNKVTEAHRKFQEEFFAWEYEKGVKPFLGEEKGEGREKRQREEGEESVAKRAKVEGEGARTMMVLVDWNTLLRRTSERKGAVERMEEEKEGEKAKDKGAVEDGERKTEETEGVEKMEEEGEEKQEEGGASTEKEAEGTRRNEGSGHELAPGAMEALQELKNNLCYLVAVGHVDPEIFNSEKSAFPEDFFSEIFVNRDFSRDLKFFSDEVFFVAASTDQAEEAQKKLSEARVRNFKILSVATTFESAKELAHSSIACREFSAISEFILTPTTPEFRNLTYTVAGFSGVQKFHLHKLLRGARLVKGERRVDLVHQEFNVQEECWDRSLWGVECKVKNNVEGRSLKMVTDKMELWRTMRIHEDREDWMPRSWSFEDFGRLKGGEVVIVKPIGARAFGGNGISVATTEEELRRAKEVITENPDWRNGVICEYIRNPLLYQNRKFHFRSYLMATSWNKFSAFPKCRILTAGAEYKDEDYENKLIHDTHVGTTELDYFFPDDFDPAKRDLIISGLKKINDRVSEALRGKVRAYRESAFGYQILALDILFDDKYQPWLLEVNTQPGFNRKTEAPPFDLFEQELLQWEFENGILPKIFDATRSRR